MRFLHVILCGLILVGFSAPTHAVERVLVLHSYHAQYQWTDELSRGIRSVLESRPNLEINFEYLDLKREKSEEYLQLLSQSLGKKYPRMLPKVVIVSDDPALDFAAKYREVLFPGVPIVFCGINDWTPERTKNIPLVTGVNETIGFEKTLDIVAKVRPNLQELLVIVDTTRTSQDNLRQLLSSLPGHMTAKVTTTQTYSFAQLQRALETFSPDQAAMFVGFWTDAAGRSISTEELEKIFQHSTVPIFGRSEWMIGRGQVGGWCVIGFEQGSAAARLAGKILDGAKIENLPVIVESPNRYVFDWEEIQHHRIDPDIFPMGSIRGKPDTDVRLTVGLATVLALSGSLLLIFALLMVAYVIERRRRIQVILEQAQRQQYLLDGLTDAVVTLGPNPWRVRSTNRRIMSVLGHSEECLTAHGIVALMAGDPAFSLERFELLLAEVMTGKEQTLVWRVKTGDGQVTWMDVSLRPLRVGSEDCVLTLWRSAEHRLKSERGREQLFTLAIDMLCIASFDGKFQQLNPAWTRCLGWSRTELLERPWIDLVHPDDQAATIRAGEQLRSGQIVRDLINRYKTKDGRWRYLSWNASPLPSENSIFAVVRDVTEHIAIQGRLRDSEERFRAIVENSPMGAHLWRLENETLYFVGANPAADAFTGIRSQNLFGLEMAKAFPGLEQTEIPTRYTEVIRSGTPWHTVTFQYQDGRVSGAFDVYAFRYAPDHMAAFFFEVTERIRMQENLRKAEEDLRITLDSIGDAVIATDAQGLVSRMNPVAQTLTGWEFSQAKGRPLSEVFQIINADTRETAADPVAKVIASGQIVGLANHTALIHKDGSERQIADSGAPIRNAKGELVGVVLVFRDVTHEYALEEQLSQARKLDAVGQLAGGVAHDFNNLLLGILGAAELIQEGLPPEMEQTRQLADLIVQTAQKAADLTRKLLDFSRKGQQQRVRINLNQIVDETQALLSHAIDKRIQIERSTQGSEPILVDGDPNQIQNAIMNLAINARDAMPSGGILNIRTEIRTIDDGALLQAVVPFTSGRYACVCIQDSGIGIPDAIRARIFEPFFTTKPTGKGTGLGLSAVFGIVQDHAGGILLESTSAKGSTFTLCFPLAGKNDQSRSSESSLHRMAIVKEHFNRHHILVVDDEEFIRTTTKQQLELAGYEVTTVNDGQAAVDLAKAMEPPFDLILMDLMMPVLHGADAFYAIRSFDPSAKIIICTGYSSKTSDVERLFEAGAAGCLQKPYRREELLRTVHQVLGETADG